MKKNQGFTLIELVVVIVILGILAVTAAPRFLNLQSDAHESRAKGVFSALSSAVNMYHGAWILQGEPSVSSGIGVIFADETVYPSTKGFPVGTTHHPSSGNSGISGSGCGELLTSLITTDLKTETYSTTMFPTDADIKYWYNQTDECTYYYTSNMIDNSTYGYMMTYSVLTGETAVQYTTFPK
ncbi:type II secretion system protein [Aliivibrio wodanis]|uniref:Membrane protein, putative pilin n=1 Tax=Aliivibrio wodanis TaxID=80852 RepID=A0A090ITW8_9GAMM|nr:membrane protein, putative pilin [Aliivibrio wodanis]VVV04540.1 Type II secretion system protein G [Aliivibrio wodanis]